MSLFLALFDHPVALRPSARPPFGPDSRWSVHLSVVKAESILWESPLCNRPATKEIEHVKPACWKFV